MATQPPYHARCTSLPPRSHPIAQQFEDQVQEVKTWVEQARAADVDSTAALSDGVRRLAKLHSCVGEILKMPQAQKDVGRSRQECWMAEELDGSVRLLDMCCSARDSLDLVKQRAVELQSAIRTRRRCDGAATERKVLQELGKEVERSLKELKQMGERCANEYPRRDGDGDLAIRALREVRQLTVTVCASVFAALASGTPRRPTTAGGYWSLVSKAMSSSSSTKHHKATRSLCWTWSCDLTNLRKRISGEGVDVVEVQRQLKEMECKVSTMEDGLERLFQVMIRNRVTLLNAGSC